MKQTLNLEEHQKLSMTACYMQPFVLAWWSAGVTSAVACKIALELYENVELYYIEIDTANHDNGRFKKDCEKWYGKKIHTLKSRFYTNQFDVIKDVRAVNTPTGAPCTLHLKKNVRFDFERLHEKSLFNEGYIKNQVWGFEFETKEVNRAIRHLQQYPATKPLFPLIEKGIDKNMCAGLLMSENIELPKMYELGYSNNNCIGCVKGGKGYWNKIRKDFPDIFNRMAILEREIGYSCLNGTFLDKLKPNAGRMKKEIMPNCGNICDVEFADIPDRNLDDIMNKRKSIYDVAS